MSLVATNISNESIELIHHELVTLQQYIYKAQSPDLNDDAVNFHAIEACLFKLKELFGDEGLTGLHAACEHVLSNITFLSKNEQYLSASQSVLLIEWKSLLKAFINDLTNEHIAKALIKNLSKDNWANPLKSHTLSSIEVSLFDKYNIDVINNERIENSEEIDLSAIHSTEEKTEVDLDLSTDQYSAHESINLANVDVEYEEGPSAQLLDNIENELFVDEHDVIIINEIPDSNNLVVIDEDDAGPANDTHIAYRLAHASDSEVKSGSAHHSKESLEINQNQQDDPLSIINQPDDTQVSSDDLTELYITPLDLSIIENKITSLTSDDQQLSDQLENDSAFNVSTSVLDTVQDELFSPTVEDSHQESSDDMADIAHESVLSRQDDADDDPSGIDAKDDPLPSDFILDSLEDELFTPVSEDDEVVSDNHDAASEELFEVSIDNNPEVKVEGSNIPVDDIINSLYVESDYISGDQVEVYNPDNPSVADNQTLPVEELDQSNAQDSIDIDYPDWNDEQKELLSLIVLEVQEALKQQQDTASLFQSEPLQEHEIREFMSLYVEQVERMASAAEMVGLLALQGICEIIHDYFVQYEKQTIEKVIDRYTIILLWPEIILNYLTDIYCVHHQTAVISYLTDDQWCDPVSEEKITELRALFSTSTIHIEKNEDNKRKEIASPEDVNIIIPDDVQTELLDGLLQELPTQTEEFSHAIQALGTSDFPQYLEVAQRIAHTIKGAANTVGITGLATITHNLEDILSALVKNNAQPTVNLQSSLVDSADCLEQMAEFLLGISCEPEDSLQTLQVILDWANYIDEFGPPVEDKTINTVEKKLVVKKSYAVNNQSISDQNGKESSKHASEASLRIPAETIDQLLMQSGENIIAASQMQEQVKQLLGSLRDVKSNRDHVQHITQNLEHLIDIQGVGGRYIQNTPDQKFDPLELDQYNELHTFSRRLLEATNDSVELIKQLEDRLTALDSIIAGQVSAQKQSQYDMLKTRMVQVDSIAARLKRGVRQAGKLCNKSVELEISGGETLVDNKILMNLIDPLMHLLRNAVDHGLESDEKRKVLHKPLPAIVHLEVRQEGDRMIVLCRDDGRGLDNEQIRHRAIEQNLIDAEQELDDEEIKQLILQHGFTTCFEVTQLSGRGVGLDVVSSQIKSMNGLLSVSSELNKGATFQLSLPVSLLSAHALLVELYMGSVAVSTAGIEEVIHLEKNDVVKKGDELVIQIEGQIYQLVHIEWLLELPQTDSNDKSLFYSALRVSGENRLVLVPVISNTREIVIKPFSRFLPKVAGMVGTTILGDGEISPVIDIRELLSYYSRVGSKQQPKRLEAQINQAELTALIVEDSLSTRKSLSEFMTDLHYKVYTAKDGLEAIELMADFQPDIILSDLEMPRMNGLELTSHLRANQTTENIPVIMITSRSTEKHIQEAKSIGVNEYLTKPFQEDILFEKVNQLAPGV